VFEGDCFVFALLVMEGTGGADWWLQVQVGGGVVTDTHGGVPVLKATPKQYHSAVPRRRGRVV